MKKSRYYVIVIGLVAAMACNTSPSKPTQESGSLQGAEGSSKTLFAVPLDSAINDIKRFKKDVRAYDSVLAKALGRTPDTKIPIKAFTIRAVDLFEALGMSDIDTVKATYKYVRVYLGLNSNSDFKLYLTPVEGANLNANPPKAGKDVLLRKKLTGLEEDERYVLDFSSPCPTTCPENSPLSDSEFIEH